MPGIKTSRFSRKTPGGVFNVEDQSFTTGDRWFVHSGTGTDGVGRGTHPDDPLATIDYAIGLATASQGDVIYVMPGHAETIGAAEIDVDKIGLSIIGLGVENDRPTITLDETTSDVDIDANDIFISGLRFISTIADLVWFIDANSERLVMEDCEFITTSTYTAINFINLATTKDHFIFRRCKFVQPTDPDDTDGNTHTGCFYIVDSEDILVEDCIFQGEFETSIFHNDATACANLWIRRCYGEQALSGADILTAETGATGGMIYCHWLVSDAADATTWGDFCTLAQGSPFGMHSTTFMNDNITAGGNQALPVAVAMA